MYTLNSINNIMKHFYDKIPGWFSYKGVYEALIKDINDNGTWVEIGSWQGRSISYAVVESLLLNKNINFNVVDIWKFTPGTDSNICSDNELYKAFLNYTKPIKDHIKIFKQDSAEAASNFIDSSVDVCMIDANHEYEFVLRDIEAWFPKIKLGGTMCGDDYSKKFPGVKQAIKDFTEKNNLTYEVNGVTWILKL